MNHFLKSRRLRFAILFLLTVFVSNAFGQSLTARYITTAATSNGYYESLPQGYSTGSQTYPLLIFIHGLGELGSGTSATLPKVLGAGPGKHIANGTFPTSFTVNGEVHRFIVITPQFVSWPKPADIQSVINYAVQNYRVNINRIYLTGLSMGGGVTWEYAGNNATYAKTLAAIVPICGASWPDMTRSKTMASANLPVWATHNSGDPTAPLTYTETYVANINAQNPNPLAKKTIFPVGGHDAWTTTYDPNFRENGLNIYEWMLYYQRGNVTTPPPPTANKAPIADAGADVTITLPTNSVTLTANGSDADGTIVKADWSKIAGPAQFTISNSAVANPVISNLVAGVYTFRLTLTDNAGATGTNDVNITVNAAPASTPPPPPPVTGGKVIPGRIEAESYDAMLGIKTETTKDAGGGLNINYVHKGDWMAYNVNVATANTYMLYIRIASNVTGGQIQLRNAAGSVLATVNVPNTGGYQAWQTISVPVALAAGSQTLQIYSSSTPAWYLNWMEFVSVTGASAGSASLSETTENALSAKASSMAISPNPVYNTFALQVNNSYTGALKVQIIDLSGSVKKEFNLSKTQNNTRVSLTAGELPAGTYFIRAQMGDWSNTQKLLKL